MSIFKCKMCGGTIEFEPGATVGVCDSCGTKQTLPRLDDDRRVNLYDRANHFRRNNEFDKAAGIYEQILNEDANDAEAYWSLVLCRYGIEYVEDPATRKRIPTVNRAQFTSIFDDENYKSAIQFADSYQRVIYEEEANTINEIQKGILVISQKEEPFDVFICYKETDQNGRRTPDSVLANDLYHQLTNEGFKVFFSRITLEDKLGTAYEPYIFAALNSAKVMVVLGTRPEYFNAVWVKNEWSRYLALIREGAKKVLIPAYRDMDPYDLPEEFSHLQAQDMSKLGFMQDLIRGIKKMAKGVETSQITYKSIGNGDNASTAPLLKRAYMFLEDGNWVEADSYCEKVLDQDPENAKAYLGKLMAEFHARHQDDLYDCEQLISNSNNYKKAMRFGGDEVEKKLSEYLSHIKSRIEQKERKALSVVNALKLRSKRITGPTLDEELVEAQKRANNLEFLLNEFDSIQTRIRGFQNEVDELLVQEKILREKRSKLGVFAGKEKKQVDDEIASIMTKQRDLLKQIDLQEKSKGKYSAVTEIEHDLNEARKKVSIFEAEIEEEHTNADGALSFDEAWSIYLNEQDVSAEVEKIYPAVSFMPVLLGKTNTIRFGRYVQHVNTQPEQIEWKVLARENGRMLVVSKYGLDWKEFDERTIGTWKTCSLRKWLNEVFINEAFNEEEERLILCSEVTTEGSSQLNESSGDKTCDKLFLLSIDEAYKYFDSDSARECQGTEYCYSKNLGDTTGEFPVFWWLRTSGNDFSHATVVGSKGRPGKVGFPITVQSAVRPAFWFDFGIK